MKVDLFRIWNKEIEYIDTLYKYNKQNNLPALPYLYFFIPI